MEGQGDTQMNTSPGLASKTGPGAPDKNTAKEALTHFATAFAFLLAGIAALVWNSERLSQGAFSDPRVLGGLHFITLGWLSLSIFGALRVFTGVALGSQGFAMGLAPWVRRLWVAGTVVFPLGLIFGVPVAILSGAFFLGAALLLFSIHIVPALASAKRGGLTRWYLVIALTSLWGAWIFGGSAASVRAGSGIVTLPAGYFLAHILLAVFGWVGATVVGVGSHLIPMFALSRESSNLPVKVALPIWGTVPVFALLGAFHPEPFLMLGYGAAALGSLLWFVQVAIYIRGRLRRERDPGLILAGGATVLLAVAWIAAAVMKAPIPFIGLIVIGWLTLFTLGIYHRVIPFLIWFARFARNAGRGPVPKVKELISEKLGMATVFLALVGVLTWAVGLSVHEGVTAYTGSLLLLIGCLLSLGQLRILLGEPRSKAQTLAPEAFAKGGFAS